MSPPKPKLSFLMPASTYDNVRLLAEGGFGVVHLVQRQKDNKVSGSPKQEIPKQEMNGTIR